MREKQYLCAVKSIEIMCKKSCKQLVIGVVIVASCLLLVGCAQSPNQDGHENGFRDYFTLTNLNDDQREVLWSDTITPPDNPFAPAIDDSMVTIVGAIGLEQIPMDGSQELYCCVTTSNYNTYFLTSRQTSLHGSTERFTLWRYDAAMLQPGYGGSPDTICVGDTIAVTGYAYTMKYAQVVVLDVHFVQKYASPNGEDTDNE